MIDINELRRLAQAAKDSCQSAEWTHAFREGQFSEGQISSGDEMIIIVCGGNYGCWRDAYDHGDSQFKALGDFVAATNPAAVTELLDRLEATEAKLAKWESVFGHLGTADEVGNEWHSLSDHLDAAEKERDALRAKIEQMERQEPVAWCATDETGNVIEALGMNQSRRFDTALYLAPGAQSATSVPEGIS